MVEDLLQNTSIAYPKCRIIRVQEVLKEYMSADLNANRLHKAFLLKHPDSLVTYKFCEIKAQGERSRQGKLDLERHHRKPETATKLMKMDINSSQMPDSITSVFSMDLEQVMFVHTLTHSDMFL